MILKKRKGLPAGNGKRVKKKLLRMMDFLTRMITNVHEFS